MVVNPRGANSFSGFIAPAVLLLAFCYALIPQHITAGSDATPIVLKSSTTIEHVGAAGDPTIRFNESETGIPIAVFFRVIPTGGTVTLEFDADAVVNWDDNDAYPGNSFDTAVTFSPNASTIGTVRINYNYLLENAYRINFDSVFHDSLNHWGKELPVLRDYLMTGTRTGTFRDIHNVPESVAIAEIQIPNTNNPFLLADSISFSKTFVDTVPLTYDFAPYPCVRLKTVATIRTEVGFTVGGDTLCMRYAPPGDTLCWRAPSGFTCQTDFGSSVTLSATIPCETVEDFVVPMCPIRAAGHARVTIGTEVDLDTLIFSYTCGMTTPTPIVGSPTLKDTTWIDQSVAFGTDRDDAIYTIPVSLAAVNVTVKDTLGGTIGVGGTLSQSDRYSINWGAIDNALSSCCSGADSLRISYRDVDVLSEASACFDYIEPQVAEAAPRTYDWVVPSISCFSSGTKFRVFLEFYCPSSQKVLYRAWSHSFTYQP